MARNNSNGESHKCLFILHLVWQRRVMISWRAASLARPSGLFSRNKHRGAMQQVIFFFEYFWKMRSGTNFNATHDDDNMTKEIENIYITLFVFSCKSPWGLTSIFRPHHHHHHPRHSNFAAKLFHFLFLLRTKMNSGTSTTITTECMYILPLIYL